MLGGVIESHMVMTKQLEVSLSVGERVRKRKILVLSYERGEDDKTSNKWIESKSVERRSNAMQEEYEWGGGNSESSGKY